MPRIPQLTTATADGDQQDLLLATERQLGRIPNLYAALANSPAALGGYLALRESLTSGTLSARLREQLALLVAHDNACTYCVSAHTFRGKKMGLSDDVLHETRTASDTDPHATAVLRLAREILANKGDVDDESLRRARAAGVTDAELAEVVAHVALNVFSNFFNHLARPELDFPEVSA
ncbi:MAG: carboxymuconolactone decarboxylase family protein [Nocardioides sp.]